MAARSKGHATKRDTIRVRRCPVSHKRAYANIRMAKTHAKAFSRHLNEAGEFVQSMYAYECDDCHMLHLTRSPGSEAWGFNTLVFSAPTRALQRWAMTGQGEPRPVYGSSEHWVDRIPQKRNRSR